MNLALRIKTICVGDPLENSDLSQQETREA